MIRQKGVGLMDQFINAPKCIRFKKKPGCLHPLAMRFFFIIIFVAKVFFVFLPLWTSLNSFWPIKALQQHRLGDYAFVIRDSLTCVKRLKGFSALQFDIMEIGRTHKKVKLKGNTKKYVFIFTLTEF